MSDIVDFTKPLNNRPHEAVDVPVLVEPIRKEDMQASYQYTMEAPDGGAYGSFMHVLGGCIGAIGAIPCCFCIPSPFSSVKQGTVGLVSRFGKFYKAVDPGLVKVNLITEKLNTVDVKIQIVEVPSQSCMTKDNVNLELTSVVYYHITSPHKAAFGVTDVSSASIERTQTTLRQVVGSKNSQDVIERREEIAKSIQEIIDETANLWGVRVEAISIKDLKLSRELQESLSMAAQSKRIGESKIISAKAEVESAKLMRKAADILASKPAMQIRYLEAMQQMAKSSNSKVIFMPSAGAIESMSGANVINGSSSEPVVPDDGTAAVPEDFSRGLTTHVAMREL